MLDLNEDKGIMLTPSEVLSLTQHCLIYYSLKTSEASSFTNLRKIKPFPKIDECSSNLLEVGIEMAEIYEDGELDIEEIIGGLEILLQTLETNKIDREFMTKNFWLIFKTCLLISHQFISDVNWNIVDYSSIVNSSVKDLSAIRVYLLKDILNFKFDLSAAKLVKTQKFLEAVKEIS